MAEDKDIINAGASVVAGLIVAAYVSKNHVPADAVAGMLSNLRDTLAAPFLDPAPDDEAVEVAPVVGRQMTGAEIEASVTPEAIISFIDGKSYQTLRRHLTKHGFSPESYRAQFGLPADYPLVAPNYSERRAALARQAGLGQQRRARPADESLAA